MLAVFLLDAFWELSSERQFGFGLGPIPWSSIVAYAEFVGLDREAFFIFLRIIREMDEAYVEWNNKSNKKSDSKSF